MNTDSIKTIFAKYSAQTTAPLGLYFKDLQSGESCALQPEQSFPAASVFKIFVLAELVRMQEAGLCSLSDRMTMHAEDRSPGSGLLHLMDDGVSMTIGDFATLMMVISDNTAADMLFRFTGRDNIRKNVIEALKLRQTKADLPCCVLLPVSAGLPQAPLSAEEFKKQAAPSKDKKRMLPAFTGELAENDTTSPADLAVILEHFYRGTWVNPAASQKVLDIMKNCRTNSRIPRLLPKGVAVAHKTGTIDRVVNDAGIVYTAKGDYILALLYNGNMASQREYEAEDATHKAEDMLAALSKEVFDVYTKESK